MGATNASASKTGTTFHIPGQGAGEAFIVVIPDGRPRRKKPVAYLGAMAWKARRALAPLVVGGAVLVVAFVLHLIAWWSCFLLAPAAVVPAVWFVMAHRSKPVRGSALAWRVGLTVVTTAEAGWLVLAVAFGPFFGPLGVLWLIALIGTECAWLIARSAAH
jgi:hypothetical protein